MFQIDYRLGIFSLTFSLFATFSFSILSPLPESWISQIGANYGGWEQKYTTEKYGKYYNGAGGQKRPAIHGRLLPIITEDLVRVLAPLLVMMNMVTTIMTRKMVMPVWCTGYLSPLLILEQAWLIKSRCWFHRFSQTLPSIRVPDVVEH